MFGVEPLHRSALPGTAGVVTAPYGQPSLFATMIVGQWYWARTAELAAAVTDPVRERPWETESDFYRIDRDMQAWEASLPARHKFSAFTLRAMKGQDLDLVGEGAMAWLTARVSLQSACSCGCRTLSCDGLTCHACSSLWPAQKTARHSGLIWPRA